MGDRDHRQSIADAAKRAFKSHIIAVKGVASVDMTTPCNQLESRSGLGPYVWECRNPASWPYWFMVAELPGAIVQYGDVGGLLIEQGTAYDLSWLEGAINSMDYVLEKTKFKPNAFMEDKFKAYVREQRLDPENYECYEDYVLQTGDSEAYSACHDWPADSLWSYWALHTFCRLRARAR